MTIELAGSSMTTGRCMVMGIVNRTPDSFFDGGRMLLEDAVDHSLGLIEEGADLLDVARSGPARERR